MNKLTTLRTRIRNLAREDENTVVSELIATNGPTDEVRSRTKNRAIELVENIRENGKPGLMEAFLAEYGLSTDEGVALMCLAEALLRVPDDQTIDELIEDKVAASSWGEHLGSSSSSLVNASTWGLMLTGKLLKEPEGTKVAETLHSAVKRLGEPVIRMAAKQAMKEMGRQLVLGRTIAEAIKRSKNSEEKGYTYSYDMLGEAALTAKDASVFFESYRNTIRSLALNSNSSNVEKNPGISVKLSALHPRYEVGQKARVMEELVPRVKELALIAKEANMGFNIDAEEADRLDLSLDVIEAVFRSPELDGWSGFGVVIQAYGKRANAVIDWVHVLAKELNRRVMVRLVKGAYWDSEIKIAQVDGVKDFPVFSQKAATDVSFICCAQNLFQATDYIYPQFATHNAHTVSTILEMARDGQAFEFQRLHGMGDSLYEAVMERENVSCRIYAPVGAHRDLLAYLVRRLLENGANSSFVNQIVDTTVPAEVVAADPFEALEQNSHSVDSTIKKPADLYHPERQNSRGWDLRNSDDLSEYDLLRQPFADKQWTVKPLIDGPVESVEPTVACNPSKLDEQVGVVFKATTNDVDVALNSAIDWSSCKPEMRATILAKAADFYEQNSGEIFTALCREAGKTPLDAVAEIREAVDFLRYYAAQAKSLGQEKPRGLITCISPWNFPLAIFTGQISAALAAGNGVLAKPADPTPIIAMLGVSLLHLAGVPKNVLQLIPGKGSIVGAKLTSDPRINGICFTGSTSVAKTINTVMSGSLEPDATLIAETGGLNAMIVDSTALPEQAIADIVVSAFQSAGQRCSALRLLYVQKDIAEQFLEMLYGAMDELSIGEPWEFSTDVGPVINASAKNEIEEYIESASSQGRLLKILAAPTRGYFVSPAVIQVQGIADLEKEIFGPVLHIATFEAFEIEQIISDINSSGYGLTFGLHTRIDDRVEQITSKLNVGNIYVNRNQIGAIVGSQPFGGEGLSGTGPKAGGPHYVPRFIRRPLANHRVVSGEQVDINELEKALDDLAAPIRRAIETIDLPGPTGESNRLSIFPKGTILCLGPTVEDAMQQLEIAQSVGCAAIGVVPDLNREGSVSGFLDRHLLTTLSGFDAVALWSTVDDLALAGLALAKRDGPITPILATKDMKDLCIHERHICIDTTAAGGNASLLAAQ